MGHEVIVLLWNCGVSLAISASVNFRVHYMSTLEEVTDLLASCPLVACIVVEQ